MMVRSSLILILIACIARCNIIKNSNNIVVDKLPHSVENIPSKAEASIEPEIEDALSMALSNIKLLIPYAIDRAEENIACSNWDQRILFWTNFAGALFGALKTMEQEKTNRELKEETSSSSSLSHDQKIIKLEELDSKTIGNCIQLFAQIAYGYGYSGRFSKTENSKLNCGYKNFDSALEQYSEVVNDRLGYLNPIMAEKLAMELNTEIKGQLITKCPVGFIVWTKLPTKLFLNFCPEIFCTFLGASCRLPC